MSAYIRPPKKRSLGRTIWDVLSSIVIAILIVFVGTELILKFSGQTIYWGGMRVDVVLTDSMSVKNEKYAAFLYGHDDQLQPYDLTYCRKIDENTDLQVYDIVIFDSPVFGPTIHRIVEITEIQGTTYYVTRGDKADTVDGRWLRSRLLAKYEGSTPKVGYVVAFFRSAFGLLMINGLIVIYILYQIAASVERHQPPVNAKGEELYEPPR